MYDFFFSSGTGHSLMVLSFVIGIGLILGTIKIKGVSLGSIWVLFVGIVFGALGLKADSLFLHFLKEFGLVLFMFTIGFQVGPSFFSSFRKHRISELLAKFEGRYSVTAIERGADSFTVVDDPVLEAGDRVCADLSSESRMMLRLCFGKKIKDLHLDRDYGVTVVRILRLGVELVALGNKSSELEKPNLIPVFIGIGLGLILGAVPISFPVMGNAIHFGLAAGPLILGIIIGHFGPKWKISTYTSTSSLRMVREIGLCLLLSTVGLGAGGAFIPSLASNGLRIMLYSAIIAFVPMLITGLVARLALKQNFYTICGLLSGATTNPVALDFSSQAYRNIHPGVAYAAVYPFALFLQILSAQLLILLCV